MTTLQDGRAANAFPHGLVIKLYEPGLDLMQQSSGGVCLSEC